MPTGVLRRTAEQLAGTAPHGSTVASAMSAYAGPHGAEFLHGQIRALLSFYDPIVRDDEYGGFNNQLRDDGTVYDPLTKHCVGTARFTVNYALASLLYGEAPHKELCQHGMSFLMERQQDTEYGGFAWVLSGHAIEDGVKWGYSVAFSLLALANAHRAGVPGAAAHIATVHALAEERYYEAEHGLYIGDPTVLLFPVAHAKHESVSRGSCESSIEAPEQMGRFFQPGLQRGQPLPWAELKHAPV